MSVHLFVPVGAQPPQPPTAAERAAIRAAMAFIEPHLLGFVEDYYAALFELYPSQRALFPGDFAQTRERFAEALFWAGTDGLDDFDLLSQCFTATGAHHLHYGVTPLSLEGARPAVTRAFWQRWHRDRAGLEAWAEAQGRPPVDAATPELWGFVHLPDDELAAVRHLLVPLLRLFELVGGLMADGLRARLAAFIGQSWRDEVRAQAPVLCGNLAYVLQQDLEVEFLYARQEWARAPDLLHQRWESLMALAGSDRDAAFALLDRDAARLADDGWTFPLLESARRAFTGVMRDAFVARAPARDAALRDDPTLDAWLAFGQVLFARVARAIR